MKKHTFTKAGIENGLKAGSLSLRKRKIAEEEVTNKSKSAICIVLELNYSEFLTCVVLEPHTYDNGKQSCCHFNLQDHFTKTLQIH